MNLLIVSTDVGKILVEVHPDGKVVIAGASDIDAYLNCEVKDGELVPRRHGEEEISVKEAPTGRRTTSVNVKIEMPGINGGVDVTMKPDGLLVKGRPKSLILGGNDKGEWEVRARDGIGDWMKDFVL